MTARNTSTTGDVTRQRRQVSMRDVARHAGVSAQTVSRVSNGSPRVLEDTRQRVVQAMRELGYRPNSAARALKSGEFRTIGVIMFNLATTGNTRTLEAIAVSAAEAGYAITLIPVAAPTQDQVHGAFTRLGELAVDAVIVVLEVHLLDAADVTLPPGAHVVVVGSGPDDRYAVVDSDQADGSRQAVEHLLDLGHATVWHVAGPEGSFAAQRRAEAWEATLLARGREVPAVLRGDWTATSGYEIGLRLPQACTAVFVANDQMALGVMKALHEAGRPVPSQVSVVGFDDVPEAGAYTPALTTIHQDFAEAGRRCVASVLRQVRGYAPAPERSVVPTTLVVRESTAVAPG